jgi:hypothetical protein
VKDFDLFLAQEHHRRLMEIAHRQGLLDSLPPARPTLRNYALLRMGNVLVSLGQKLRSASLITPPTDLSQDCV